MAASIIGRNASIFSSVSTISTTMGKSSERRRMRAVWTRLCAPKPAMPRSTVPPARPCARLLDDPFIEQRAVVAVALADENAEQMTFLREYHGDHLLRSASVHAYGMTPPVHELTPGAPAWYISPGDEARQRLLCETGPPGSIHG
jgi:hypothetical protein